MFCPKCGGEKSKVINSRDSDSSHYPAIGAYDAVYRRRECKECGYRWTTYEIKADLLELE